MTPGRTLPTRIALLSSVVGGTCVLVTALGFGYLQKLQLEDQVITEGRLYAERFTTWTLGYFYQQDNLLHLETQQQFLNASPNIVYSYIVRDTGKIDLGIDGVNSAEIGAQKQEWEPPVELRFDKQVLQTFVASQSLAQHFAGRVKAGDNVRLLGFPISCPERPEPCAQLRVAIVPQSARNLANRLTLAVSAFGLFAAALSGLSVFLVARNQVKPVRRLTSLMELAKTSGYQAIDQVRASLGNASAREAEELSSLRSSLVAYVKTIEDSTANEAIARSIQALAHDVRKPFALVNMIVSVVENEKNSAIVKEFLREAVPEIQAAVTSVNGMIQDVMDIGNRTALVRKPTNLQFLLLEALNEVFRGIVHSNITLRFELSHKHKIHVASQKVIRAIANIISNAQQAMNGAGEIWFKSKETDTSGNVPDGGEALISLTIGNTGSFIDPSKRERIFDLFYTSGKAHGTGLGLAIVKKVITEHGGSIRCHSEKSDAYPTGMVAFIMTLPRSAEPTEEFVIPMPKNASSIAQSLRRHLERDSGAIDKDSSPNNETIIEANITDLLDSSSTNPLAIHTILMVDDETIYHDAIAQLLGSPKDSFLAARIRLVSARDLNSALQVISTSVPLFVIQDLDLGAGKPDGLEVTKAIRNAGYEGQICIHSNQFGFDDGHAAINAGASLVFPKPLSRIHLLKLIRAALAEQSRGYL